MSNGSEPVAVQPQAPTQPKTWGYFATFGWVLLAHLIATIVTIIALYLWDPATIPSDFDFSALMKDAQYVSLTTIIANVIQVGILIGATWIVGWKASDYLAMNWPPRQEIGVAFISLVVLLPLLDGMAYLVGQPIIPPFMTDIYRNAQSTGTLPLLWLAIVVAAPIAEEIIFRGFIFRGWVRPSQRPMIGILMVTSLFAVIHLQYNWFGIFQVFLIGLLLTWTRWRSGSTLLPMLLHFIANFYAMLQVIVFIDWFS
jgi:membrane protease YdiL (CAAX protease family)